MTSDPNPPIPKCAAVLEQLHDIIAGKVSAIPSPLPVFNESFGGGFREGDCTILAGSEGAGKSHFLLQHLIHCDALGILWKYYYLEDDKVDVTKRILSHLINDRRVSSIDPEKVGMAVDKLDKVALERAHRMSRNVIEHPSLQSGVYHPVTHRDILTWVKTQADLGVQLLAIDPTTRISFREQYRKSFDLQEDFVNEITLAIRNYPCHIILVCHLGKGEHGAAGNVAGSAAFTRFAHNVLKLAHHPVQSSRVIDHEGNDTTISHNRTLTIAKARNGIPFTNIAMNSPSVKPSLDEYGIIVEEPKHGRR